VDASNKKPAEAQGLDSSAFERAAIVFAFMRLDAPKLYAIISKYTVEADRMTIVRGARALFWRWMRERDRQWGL
jgi:hypothetical protein